MKYTNALCEKDFTIIKQLNQFTNFDTFEKSMENLICKSDFYIAERLKVLYPIRLKELKKEKYILEKNKEKEKYIFEKNREKEKYILEKNKEFSDCTIPISSYCHQDDGLKKYYLIFSEFFVINSEMRLVSYGIYRDSSREMALSKYSIERENRINKDATKMIASNTLHGKKTITYFRIRELNEETVDLKDIANNYFMETGIKLLENVSTLVMKNYYDDTYSYVDSKIYEDNVFVGIAYNLYLDTFRSKKIDRKTMAILLWYYIGFTPEQIEYKLSYGLF